MNLNRRNVKRKLHKMDSPIPKLYTKTAVNIYKLIVVMILFLVTTAGAFGYGAFNSILASTPDLSIDDVSPTGYASKMVDADGNEMRTLVQAGSNRSKVSYDDLPENLVNAFIAIEDERFLTHNGVDVQGIGRAIFIGLRSFHFSEGASTITQQLIKNNVFNGGAESSFGSKVERKIQEQYLALELEDQVGKDWIMENYVNTINLGNNTLGVQAASTRYFNKEVSELTLSECAVIAAITQNPSAYNPIRFPEKNKERQQRVLKNMRAQGLISQEEYDEAIADDVYARVQNVSNTYSSSAYTYFEDAVIDEVVTDLQKQFGYNQTQAYNLLYSSGLTIYTTQDPDIQATMDKYVNDPSLYPVTRYTCDYYLKVESPDKTVTSYSASDIVKYYSTELNSPAYKLLYDTEDELRDAVTAFKKAKLDPNDKILTETLTFVLEPQVSMTIIDNRTGYVVAISGGRGDKTNSLSLNRATNSTRSPGSCFKVVADFAPAVDLCGATLATTYYDSPLDSDQYSFVNWWGDGYVGYANVRQGIMYSMNLVSVKCLMDTVSPSLAYKYATNFGISTLVESRTLADGTVASDIVPSICLGGLTDGVTNLELTGAYETIANGGTYKEPVFYTKVTDASGKVLLSKEQETHSVLKPSTAALLTKAMEHVFDDTLLYTAKDENGTATAINPTCMGLGLDNMACAGKSGSTTTNNDVWFEGFTPYYTCGIWSGYDDSISFGSGQTFHKEIWKAVMDEIHEGKENIGFVEYEPLETAKICSKSGLLAIEGVCDCEGSNSIVYEEYFAQGTVPTEYCNCHVKVNVCKDSGLPAGPECPSDSVESRVFMVLDESLYFHQKEVPETEPGKEPVNILNNIPFTTYDEEFAVPFTGDSICNLHEKTPETEEDTEEDSDSEDSEQPEEGNSET